MYTNQQIYKNFQLRLVYVFLHSLKRSVIRNEREKEKRWDVVTAEEPESMSLWVDPARRSARPSEGSSEPSVGRQHCIISVYYSILFIHNYTVQDII